MRAHAVAQSLKLALHCRASGYRFGATMPPSAKVQKQHLKQEKKKDAPENKLQQSRKQMLGYLKYTGSDSKGATKEQKEQAQVALKVYEALPPNKKNAFIDRWKSTKDSKNMGWVRDFEETLSKMWRAVAHNVIRKESNDHNVIFFVKKNDVDEL